MKVLQLHYSEERIKLPREDAWAIDAKNGIFAVADGVHLRKGIEYKTKYPRPSPAGKLSQEFCDTFLKFARRSNMKDAFARANRLVFHFNKKRDRYHTLEKAEAYYAATGAFGKIKNRILEWGYICDSSVSVIGLRGELKMFGTEHAHYHKFGRILREYSDFDATYMFRTLFRNALSPEGKKLGYGVVTGEKSAEPYVWYGKRKLHKGEVVVFATDGFEKYLQVASFRKALLSLEKGKVEQEMLRLKKLHKNGSEFVSERTLVVVRVD